MVTNANVLHMLRNEDGGKAHEKGHGNRKLVMKVDGHTHSFC